jgi:ferritin-like protein
LVLTPGPVVGVGKNGGGAFLGSRGAEPTQKEITEDARIEDRNHFEALVPRICELGGKLPQSMNDFHDISACPPAHSPALEQPECVPGPPP